MELSMVRKVIYECEKIDDSKVLNFLEKSKYIFLPETDFGFGGRFKDNFRDVLGFVSFTAGLDERDLVRVKIMCLDKGTVIFGFFCDESEMDIYSAESIMKQKANEDAERNLECFIREFEWEFGVKANKIYSNDMNKIETLNNQTNPFVSQISNVPNKFVRY